MTILTPGHKYIAQNFEDLTKGQTLQFIEKETVFGEFGENTYVTKNDGTTNEELLEILLDRLSHLNDLQRCKENACAITHLEEALMWLEKREKNNIH